MEEREGEAEYALELLLHLVHGGAGFVRHLLIYLEVKL